MSAAGALTALGADLSFSVSYNIASELLDAASEAHITEEELICIVLGLSVLIAAVPNSLQAARRVATAAWSAGVVWWRGGQDGSRAAAGPGARPGHASAGAAAPGAALGAAPGAAPATAPAAAHSDVLEFLLLLLRMAHRISISICVQLLASNVRTKQPLRSVRIASLLAVSLFFLFLESASRLGTAQQR